MNPSQQTPRRHESIDHEHPTDAGLMNETGDDVPGTGIMGDETLVRTSGESPPGIAPGAPAGTGANPDAGPTPERELKNAQE